MADAKKKKGITFKMSGGRWFILGVAAVGAVSSYIIYTMNHQNSQGAIATAKVADTANGVKQNIAGSTAASEAYVDSVKQDNKAKSQQAMQSGASFVATPVLDSPNLPPPPKPIAQVPEVKPQPAPAPVAYKPKEINKNLAGEISQIGSAVQSMSDPGSASFVYTAELAPASADNVVPVSVQSDAKPAAPVDPMVKGLHAGQLIYGVFQTAASSSVPGPVLGTLVQGKWNGYKVLGAFTKVQGTNLLSIKATKMVTPSGEVAQITAYFVDPDTTLPGMATDVDRHIFERAAAFAGATFLAGLQGYGQLISTQGAQTTSTLTGSVTTFPTMSNQQLAAASLGYAAGALQPVQQLLTNEMVQPNTISIKEGSPFILLVVDSSTDATLKANASPQPADAMQQSLQQQQSQQQQQLQQQQFLTGSNPLTSIRSNRALGQ